MITKKTAYDIWIAYDEIEKSEKLLAEMQAQLSRGETVSLRDAFGRPRSLQLGVPSGENSHRLFDVNPGLAVAVIKAHIADHKARLDALNLQAHAETHELYESQPIRAEPPPVVNTQDF